MYKNVLERYLQKYSLNGNVNSVVMDIKDKKANCRFKTQDNSMLGEVKLNKIELDDFKLGILDTAGLQKMLNIMDDNITIQVKKAGNKPYQLKINDNNVKATFALADLNIFEEPPTLKKIPKWSLEQTLTNKEIQLFVKSKNALSHVESFAVVNENNQPEIIIGWKRISSNTITIPLQNSDHSDLFSHVLFNADIVRDIFVANKESKTAKMFVSKDGLLKLSFEVDNFQSTYYVSACKGDD